MERLDEVLAKWGSDLEAFPEELRTREETGCCYSVGPTVSGHKPGGKTPPP